jgi:hypothetical protein
MLCIFLVPEPFWCQHFFWCQSLSGVSTFLVPEPFWCQHFSGAKAFLVSAFFWCQSLSGVSTFLVPEPFWCQHSSGARAFLVPEHLEAQGSYFMTINKDMRVNYHWELRLLIPTW